MYSKLVFARPGGLWLTINRRGNTVVAYLSEAGEHAPMLSFGTAPADRCYIAEEERDRRSLCVGQHSSFHLSAEEAEIVRERVGLARKPIGDGTSFEIAQPAPQSTRDLLLGVIKAGTEAVAGVTLERAA